MDINKEKIGNLKKGIIPVYEPGLAEKVHKNLEIGSLHFTTDIREVLKVSEICFIAVGTPMGGDGSANLGPVMDVARGIE